MRIRQYRIVAVQSRQSICALRTSLSTQPERGSGSNGSGEAADDAGKTARSRQVSAHGRAPRPSQPRRPLPTGHGISSPSNDRHGAERIALVSGDQADAGPGGRALSADEQEVTDG